MADDNNNNNNAAATATNAIIEDDESSSFVSKQSCRYYEEKFPEVDQLVMVRVRSLAEMGAYVSLLEYNNIEGMILFSELSRRRIRSISKLIRVGRQEAVVVLRVDKEKGYIDLSKRRVSPEDFAACEEKYNKSKAVYSIMRHCAEVLRTEAIKKVEDKIKLASNDKEKIDAEREKENVEKHNFIEELMETIAWPLYRKFVHAFDAFKLAVVDPDKAFASIAIDQKIKELLLEIIQKRLKPQPVKIRADIEVTCFEYEGIEAIKAALKIGKSFGTSEAPISIKLVAPPLYVLGTTSLDKQEGIELLKKSVDAITEEMKKRKGNVKIKVAPRPVTESDDHALTSLMLQLEKQNEEVPGDEGSDEEEEEEEDV